MVSAPGKLVILGDYAVLEGGTAMVAAVNRRATATLATSPEPPSEVVQAVLQLAAPLAFDPGERGLQIDTHAFHDQAGRKLGIGSSAAVAVVASALALGRRDQTVLELALRAHQLASGGGSGVDVAACFHGGVIAAQKQPAPIRALPPRLSGLEFFVLFTEESARTSELVRVCQAAPNWRPHCAGLGALAQEGITAWLAQDAAAFLSVVARYGRAMAALGQDAGAPVVTERIEAVMRRAQEAGGAAKPSGAGGGDVVVGFSADPELGQRLAAELGLTCLGLKIDPLGLDG